MGSDFSYLLCDQAKGNRLCRIVVLVITKTDRLERIDRFAGFVHRLDIMLIPARRDVRASESSVAVYGYQIGIGPDLWLNIGIDLADIATIAHIFTSSAYGNNVTTRDNVEPRRLAHSNIMGAGSVI